MFCINCGKENVDTASFCGSCGGQISSQATQSSEMSALGEAELASVGRRLGALALDVLIMVITIGVVWLIWSLIVWGRGQTPGKQLVGIYAARINAPEQPLSWGNTALREFVFKELLFGILLTIVSGGLAWLLDNLWALWDGSGHSQTLHDKMMKGSVYRRN